MLFDRAKRWTMDNLLWIVAMGLMLASSGIDGVYMALWMPIGWAWLGLVLNTVADIANPVISHRFGQLQHDPSAAKRKASWILLGAEVVAVAYSWFFSWRQLLRVLPTVEPEDYPWIAFVSAGFIPLLLAFVGYAESLREARALDVTKPYLCPTCRKPFATQKGLRSHMVQKHKRP